MNSVYNLTFIITYKPLCLKKKWSLSILIINKVERWFKDCGNSERKIYFEGAFVMVKETDSSNNYL